MLVGRSGVAMMVGLASMPRRDSRIRLQRLGRPRKALECVPAVISARRIMRRRLTINQCRQRAIDGPVA